MRTSLKTAGGRDVRGCARRDNQRPRVVSQSAGRTLAEAEPAKKFGVQMAGIRRRRRAHLRSPGADERVQAGDEELVLGAPEQLRNITAWLQAEPQDRRAAD